jgi:hypothetical protein
MQKIFKVFLGLVVLCFILITALLFAANPILERVKPHILSSISSTINGEVTADEIKVQFLPWPGFYLSGLMVKNPKGDDLKLGSLSLDLALRPLLSRQVEVRSVKVSGVRVPMVLLENGNLEIAGISLVKKEKEGFSKSSQSSVPDQDSEVSPKDSPLAIRIERIDIQDVSLNFEDRKSKARYVVDDVRLLVIGEGQEYNFNASINAGKDTITAKGSFTEEILQKGLPVFHVEAVFHIDSLEPYFAFAPDLDLKGLYTAGAIPGNLKVVHRGREKNGTPESVLDSILTLTFMGQKVSVDVELTDLLMPKLKSRVSFPSLVLQPLLSVLIPENTPQYSGGLKEFSCDITSPSISQSISFNCNSSKDSIENIPFFVEALQGEIKKGKVQQMNLSEANFILGEGSLNTKASTRAKGQESISFSSSIKVDGIQISDLIALAPDAHRNTAISGKIDDITASLKGTSGSKDLTSGTFKAAISSFTINKYNFLKDLFSVLDAVPGVNLEINEAIPDGYRRILTSENTSFEKLAAEGSIQGEKITLNSFLADAHGYQVNGSGTISTQNIDLDVQVILEKDLVSHIEKKKPKVERYKEEDGTVILPITFRKKGSSKPLIVPDVNRLLKQQAGAEIKKKAEKALDRLKPGLGDALGGFFKKK